MQENNEHPGRIVIFINDQRYFAPSPTMTGAEIKQLGNIPVENFLYKEEPGSHPDTRVPDDMAVELKSGMKFYDLPPAVRGRRG